jgi:hypothetical protein
MSSASASSISAQAVLTAMTGAVLSVSPILHVNAVDETLVGASAEFRARPVRELELHLAAQARMPWNESASTLREGGLVDSATATVYATPFGSRILFGVAGRASRFSLAQLPDAVSDAWQLFGVVGVDVVVATDPSKRARGEILDRQLLWPAAVASAAVVSLRHYELNGDDPFGVRLKLVEDSRLDEISTSLRQVLGDGVFSLELRAGFGRDWLREMNLWRAGGTLLLSVVPRSRITLDYDVSTESRTGLTGRRHTATMSLHVDL